VNNHFVCPTYQAFAVLSGLSPLPSVITFAFFSQFSLASFCRLPLLLFSFHRPADLISILNTKKKKKTTKQIRFVSFVYLAVYLSEQQTKGERVCIYI